MVVWLDLWIGLDACLGFVLLVLMLCKKIVVLCRLLVMLFGFGWCWLFVWVFGLDFGFSSYRFDLTLWFVVIVVLDCGVLLVIAFLWLGLVVLLDLIYFLCWLFGVCLGLELVFIRFVCCLLDGCCFVLWFGYCIVGISVLVGCEFACAIIVLLVILFFALLWFMVANT